MSLSHLLKQAVPLDQLPALAQRHWSPGQLREGHVAFSGAPLQHPYDADKILLVADPHSHTPLYYAFRVEDVAHVEKLPSISSEDGEIVPMARVWVKKGSVGLRHVPFIVEDMTAHAF